MASGGHTRATDIAGVPVNLRRYKHHVALQSFLIAIFRALSQLVVSNLSINRFQVSGVRCQQPNDEMQSQTIRGSSARNSDT